MTKTTQTARLYPPISDKSSAEECQRIGMIRKGSAFFVGRGKGYGNKQASALQVAVFLTLAFHFS